MGTKIMLLGIAIILAAIALSIDNIIAFGGGVLGLIVVIIGLFKSEITKISLNSFASTNHDL